MPGIVLGETSSTTNPRLLFFYRSLGLLADVYELRLEIKDALTGTVRFTDAALNLAAAPAGVKLGTGRYAAPFTAAATPVASAWSIGTHVAIWRYRLTDGGTQYTVRQRFEVLDPNEFSAGAEYVGYAATMDLKKLTPFDAMALGDLQRIIDDTSRRIELYTGRFFEPRYMTVSYDGTSAGTLPFGHPVIAIDEVWELGLGPADQLFQIDGTALRVYNRHLDGLLDPDDRDNPKIDYATDIVPGSIIAQGTFIPGSKNVQVNAVFGYTDPDGTPCGTTPRLLTRLIGMMAARQQLDPLGLDATVSNPGRVKGARTRDQAITYQDGSASGGGASSGSITGDKVVDDMLIHLLRPPHLGSA